MCSSFLNRGTIMFRGLTRLLERFTRNQIEYIDDLSSIASAFSSFAKMPVTNPVEVNILDQIRITLELFKNTDNVTFKVHWPEKARLLFMLIKNSLMEYFQIL